MTTAVKVSDEYVDGELVAGTWNIQGSGKNPYEIKLKDTVWSCNCPAWRNQSKPINERLCKHTAQVIAVVTGKSVVVPPVKKPVQQTETEKAFSDQVTLAHVYTDQDVMGWWASEKLDGVRAIWLPKEKRLLSRNGKEFHAPDWFKLAMPDYSIDGELWVGRGKFQETVSIVRQANGDDTWLPVMFMAFDIFVPGHPDHPVFKRATYERRYDWMSVTGNAEFAKRITVSGRTIQPLSDRAFLLPQHSISSGFALRNEFDRVQKLGGEGLVLRNPNAMYEGGRSHNLLKYKKMLDDVALVIGIEEGEGKNKGRMGALVCRLKSGVEFKVGTGYTDGQRRSWWSTTRVGDVAKAGYVIEFTYQELTNDGVPRFPAFQRVRGDLNGSF